MLYLVVCKPNFALTRFDSIDRDLPKIGTKLDGVTHRLKVIPVASDSGIWLVDFPDNDFPANLVISALQVRLATKEFVDIVFVTPITKDSAYSMPLESDAYQFLKTYFAD